MRKKKTTPTIAHNILIGEIAAEGKCIAKYEDKVIFVEKVAPGDIVDIRIFKSKKNFAFAEAIKFHEYSPLRAEPFCKHFGICGGCKWQHINYDTQLFYKQKQVKDSFERIAKIPIPELRNIFPSKQKEYYRNKLEYTFSNNRWFTREELKSEEVLQRNALGFHIPEMYDKIIDVEHCYLQADPSNLIRQELRRYAIQEGISFFDIKKKTGVLRILIIRNSIATNQMMVVVQFGENDENSIQKVMNHLKYEFPQITSLQYVINTKGNDTFHDLEIICYSGQPYIEEQMEGLSFRISAKSFYQTNSLQAHELYKIALQFAALKGNELVYDLYTGTGTIANFVARHCKKVIGIEYVPSAIEDAKINSAINKIDNTLFFAGDMKDVLTNDFVYQHGKPDVIITDPPRAGMHEEVIKTILQIKPSKIVYISCNPATQARDSALLDQDYEVVEIMPVDMFPHTHHVENVILMKIREN